MIKFSRKNNKEMSKKNNQAAPGWNGYFASKESSRNGFFNKSRP